jgi:hypothetical protein
MNNLVSHMSINLTCAVADDLQTPEQAQSIVMVERRALAASIRRAAQGSQRKVIDFALSDLQKNLVSQSYCRPFLNVI